jgi:hypothetical protein
MRETKRMFRKLSWQIRKLVDDFSHIETQLPIVSNRWRLWDSRSHSARVCSSRISPKSFLTSAMHRYWRFQLKIQIGESWVIIRTAAQRPAKEPIFFSDGKVIYAGVTEFG